MAALSKANISNCSYSITGSQNHMVLPVHRGGRVVGTVGGRGVTTHSLTPVCVCVCVCVVCACVVQMISKTLEVSLSSQVRRT